MSQQATINTALQPKVIGKLLGLEKFAMTKMELNSNRSYHLPFPSIGGQGESAENMKTHRSKRNRKRRATQYIKKQVDTMEEPQHNHSN